MFTEPCPTLFLHDHTVQVPSFEDVSEQEVTNLHLHRTAVDELASCLGVVKDDRGLLAAVEDNTVAPAGHPHGAPFAAEHVHGLVVMHVCDDNVLGAIQSWGHHQEVR